jgi:hypothetical protein
MTKIHLKSKLYKKQYFKLNYNQLLILDALLELGGREKKFIDKKNNLRYSEHFGLLDFENNTLSKIIISSKKMREDHDDFEILLPDDIVDIKHYEFIFHTHPPTPSPGYRAKHGILYEFPSISDIFHYAEHFNNGKTQGSIIIAPEGIYILYTLQKIYKIDIPSDKIFKKMQKESINIQQKAIARFGIEISEQYFYSIISQENYFFNKFKKIIKKYFNNQMTIKFVKRIYCHRLNKWIINRLSLPVNVNA